MLAGRQLTAAFLASFLAGCAPASEADDLSAGPRPSNATRSATCLSWQDAMCEFAADKCQTMSRTLCDEELGMLFCESDDAARACLNALPSASCPESPEACQQVADKEPARWYCLTFIDFLCTRGEACGLETSDECRRSAAEQLDCDDAVGADPDVETCLTKLASWPCQSLAAGQLPEECVGPIKLLSGATH